MNLVYMSVFHNRQYLDLLKLLMVSIKMFSAATTDIEFLVLTSADFAPAVQEIATLTGIPLRTKLFNFTSMHEAACARLYVFDYEDIDRYEKILYLDTDMIVQGDLSVLFAEDIADKIHALPERSVTWEHFGGWFYDFKKINKKTPGMNSGILLFRNTASSRTIFANAIGHIIAITAAGGKLPVCLDQPFVNYHTIKEGKQDTCLLLQYAHIYDNESPPAPTEPTDVILCHFAWPIGNSASKLERMKIHMTHLLDNYTAVFGKSAVPHLDKQYSWRHGFLQIKNTGQLETSWGRGHYKWLGTYVMEAVWQGYSHVLKFNESYTGYIAVRKGDADCINGVILN